MRIFFSIFTIVLLLLQLGAKTGVYVWYEWNKEYISATLCENRDTPSMHCDGKCVLAQKIKAAESPLDAPAIPLSEIQNEIAPCTAAQDSDFALSAQYDFIGVVGREPLRSELRGDLHEVFHPPTTV